MKDKIETEIENGNLEYAKSEIQLLEKSIFTEKSDYIRCKTLDRINKYKNLYSQKIQLKEKDMEKLSFEIITETESFKTKRFLDLDGLIGKTLNIDKHYSSGKLSNCRSCIFNYFEIEESLIIENCEACTIICKTQQLRIKNSKNLFFELFIKAGTSLENCSEISFRGLNIKNGNKLSEEEVHKNNYKNVNDFTNPFESKSFIFLTQ